MNLWACENICSSVWLVCCFTWIIIVSILINKPYNKTPCSLNHNVMYKLTSWINYWRNQLHEKSRVKSDCKLELIDHESVWVTRKENCNQYSLSSLKSFSLKDKYWYILLQVCYCHWCLTCMLKHRLKYHQHNQLK